MDPRPGDVVGRYKILRPIGRGGMGEVYAAHDPELDRSVALKLVRPGPFTWNDPDALLHEARAAAALTHPNVVTIHDVGSHAEGVYLAMELIDGTTLRRWIEDRSPSRARILDAYVAAARGLAAAHAAGVVHRDFKPDNVMMAADGRVIVLDFGLAGFADPTIPSKQRGIDHRPAAGTPAYMAPEQHMRLSASPATDQFAFCVALHESLTGRHPFAGKGALGIAAAVTENARDREPLERLPRRVRNAIDRGLAPRPADRWPSMTELARVLARRHAIPPLWIGVGVAAGLIAAGAAWLATADGSPGCGDGQQLIEEAWNAERRAALEEAFDAIPTPYAVEAQALVGGGLDHYAAQWRAAYGQACTVDPEELDRRIACLHDARREFAALVEVLAEVDASSLPDAVRSVDALTLTDECLHPQDPIAVPDALVDEVDLLRRRLSRARALRLTGRYETSFERVRELAVEAEALGFAPVQIEVDLELGHAAEYAGEFATARAALERAFERSQAVGLDRRAASAAERLVSVVGYRLGRREEAEAWGRHAEALLRRTGQDGGVAKAALRTNQALAAEAAGDFGLALRRAQEAVAIAETIDDREVKARALNNLGNAERLTDNTDAALTHLERALQLRREQWGGGHPEVATGLVNLANVHVWRGEVDKAEELYKAAQHNMERSLGASHPNLAIALSNLASIMLEERPEEATALLERVVEIRRARLGPDHGDTLVAEGLRARAWRRAGRTEEALRTLLELAPRMERVLGPEDGQTVQAWLNVARARWTLGRRDEARTTAEQLERLDPVLSDADRLELDLMLFELRDRQELSRAEAEARLDVLAARARDVGAGFPAKVEELRAER